MSAGVARSRRTQHPLSGWQVFRVPIVLGVLSAVGLVSALVGDEAWDVLSWLTLVAPIGVAGWAWVRRS